MPGRSVQARLLLVSLVVAALGVLAADPAGACLCAVAGPPVTHGELDLTSFENADVVFTGVATEVPSRQGVIEPFHERVMTFAVDEVFKGEVVADQEVATSRSSCGLEGIEEGTAYVVFASAELRQPMLQDELEEGQVATHACEGTRPLEDAALPTAFGDGSPPRPPTEPEADWDELRLWVASGALLSVAIATVGVTLGVRARRR